MTDANGEEGNRLSVPDNDSDGSSVEEFEPLDRVSTAFEPLERVSTAFEVPMEQVRSAIQMPKVLIDLDTYRLLRDALPPLVVYHTSIVQKVPFKKKEFCDTSLSSGSLEYASVEEAQQLPEGAEEVINPESVTQALAILEAEEANARYREDYGTDSTSGEEWDLFD